LRTIVFLLVVFAYTTSAYAQRKYSVVYADSASNSLFLKAKWKQLSVFGTKEVNNNVDFFDLDYRIGMAYYNRKMYALSEQYFKKAFAVYPTNDIAKHIYYGLIFRGLFSEAAVFNEQYQKITEIKNIFTKGTESIYSDVGLRYSSDKTLEGNMLYTDFGRISKPAQNIALLQSIYFLHQTYPSGNYKQMEYFISRDAYYKNGWYLNPSLHYALTLTSGASNVADTYANSVNSFIPPNRNITVFNNGIYTQKFSFPGMTHSLNLAYSISKRNGPLTFGIEPALQAILNTTKINVNYVDTGISDSFINRVHILSYPYKLQGASTKDTGTFSMIGQIGASINYIWQINGAPLSSKLSGYYLFDNKGTNTAAWNFYTLVKTSTNCWLHLSYTYKGNLPWAFNADGQYFNTYNTINSRTGITMQLFPLKRFSPMLTYQYEQDQRYSDNKTLIYNSFYFTLKYKL